MCYILTETMRFRQALIEYSFKHGAAKAAATAEAIEEVEAAKADKAEWVGVTISASGWVSDASVPEKPYRYDISVSDVTEAGSADVNISVSAAKCGLSARTSTAAGKIQLRAKTKPSADMAAEYRIWKGV